MNRSNWKSLLAASALLAPCFTHAQDPLRGTLTMGMGDVAVIKQKAEAGDAAAQVALGDTLASRLRRTPS